MLPTKLGEKQKLDVEQFVGTVNDDLLCTICEDVMVNPHTCQEGHAFCHECICLWLNKSQTCPTDRQALSESGLTKHRLASNLISKLRVRCCNANSLHGVEQSASLCAWTGQLAQRTKHLKEECAFVEEQCPLKCGESMLRGQLAMHKESCANTEMECPFAEFGCATRATRRKIGEHEMTSIFRHSQLVSTWGKAQQNRVAQLEKDLETKDTALERLKLELENTTKQNSALTAVLEEKTQRLSALEAGKQAQFMTEVESLLEKQVSSLQTEQKNHFATLQARLFEKKGGGLALQSNAILREGGKKFRVEETDASDDSGEDIHSMSFSEQEAVVLRDMRKALEKVCTTLHNDPEFTAFRQPGLVYVLDRELRKTCKKMINHPMDLATVRDEVQNKIILCPFHLLQRMTLIRENVRQAKKEEEKLLERRKNLPPSMYAGGAQGGAHAGGRYEVPEHQELILQSGSIVEVELKDHVTGISEWTPSKVISVNCWGDKVMDFRVHILVSQGHEQHLASHVRIPQGFIIHLKPHGERQTLSQWRWPCLEQAKRQRANARIQRHYETLERQAKLLFEEANSECGKIDPRLTRKCRQVVTGRSLPAPPVRAAKRGLSYPSGNAGQGGLELGADNAGRTTMAEEGEGAERKRKRSSSGDATEEEGRGSGAAECVEGEKKGGVAEAEGQKKGGVAEAEGQTEGAGRETGWLEVMDWEGWVLEDAEVTKSV